MVKKIPVRYCKVPNSNTDFRLTIVEDCYFEEEYVYRCMNLDSYTLWWQTFEKFEDAVKFLDEFEYACHDERDYDMEVPYFT